MAPQVIWGWHFIWSSKGLPGMITIKEERHRMISGVGTVDYRFSTRRERCDSYERAELDADFLIQLIRAKFGSGSIGGFFFTLPGSGVKRRPP